MRTGADYLRDLSDPRSVYVNGELVEEVTSHPAFAEAARSIASLFDLAADPANDLCTTAPETGRDALTAYVIPRSREDLCARRRAISTWADVSEGFIGRGPDHVANFFAGFASWADLFDRNDNQFSENVRAFYARMLDESLYLSYTILPPQVDRGATAGDWEEQFLQVGVVDVSDSGIIVRGCQALGTAAPLSDYVFVSCIKPLRPGDETYANSFVVPIGAEGLKLLCRRPYAPGQPSSFDYPLSTRFDESDALAVFDDVLVPWEHVFVLRDVEMLRHQFFTTPAHVLGNSQAQIRFVAKLQFIAGIARKIAATNGIDKLPPVQEKLGELAALASLVEGMTIAAESTSIQDERGVERPNPRFLYGIMALQSELYPRVIQIVRDLSGVGVMQLPGSVEDMRHPDIGASIERFVQSPGVSAEDRIKLFKLAWDVIGSEFAGRHQQYEMFYAGAPFIVRGYSFRNYGYEQAVDRVERFLAGYSADEGLVGSPARAGTEEQ
jgi:4-hydroxyphenylacetate 3-monooxygenase